MNSLKNNNATRYAKREMHQNMSTTTFLYVFSMLLVIGVGVYLFNQYKVWKASISLLSPQSKNDVSYECPDYWETVGTNKCKNINKIGKCSLNPSNNVMDFNDEIFTNGQSGQYSKCMWAKYCDVVWGGVDKAC